MSYNETFAAGSETLVALEPLLYKGTGFMDHAQAIQMQAAEKYLLGEFSAAEQDEFAEHFFDCEECAKDLRLTALFMDTAKRVMAVDLEAKPQATVTRSSIGWQPAWYAVAASIALLAVILYQNVVTMPKLRSFAAPQALEYFSIVGMGSRSRAQTVLTPIQQKPFVLLLDVPPHENIYEYRCEISGATGNRVLSRCFGSAGKENRSAADPCFSSFPGELYIDDLSRSKQEASYSQFEKYPFQIM